VSQAEIHLACSTLFLLISFVVSFSGDHLVEAGERRVFKGDINGELDILSADEVRIPFVMRNELPLISKREGVS